ncbi:MAG: NRDE family protein [Stenotrophomonas sp.]
MCVLAMAWQAHPRWQLLLIGNRDEFHSRPTAAAAPWPDAPILGGRDLRAGGSWMATDGRGRLAVLTNVRDPLASQDGPSRGALVAGFLQQDSPPAVHLQQLAGQAGRYAPFNLLLADATGCHYLGNHPLQQRAVEAGVHGLSNATLDSPWPKSEHLRLALQRWLAAGKDTLTPLWQALASEQSPADACLPDTGVGLERERQLGPVFIRGEHYGTRASTIVAIDHAGAGWLIERRYAADGLYLDQSHWRFDGHGTISLA